MNNTYNREYYLKNKDKYINYAIDWQKNNWDKFKIIQKRYYGKNIESLRKYSKNYYHSEHGKLIKLNYMKKNKKIHNMKCLSYYYNHKAQYDRYRYKWILKDKDLHTKNYRIAKLFICRINKIIKPYKLNYKNDIMLKSNGIADIKIKNIKSKNDINKIKKYSYYWQDNFNNYVGTKIQLKLKSNDMNKYSNYDMIVSFK
jgi:hypothetical protein